MLCRRGNPGVSICLPLLQDVDEATRRALLDFSYHLAVGSLEEAFRAVRGVRNMAVWRSMAHLSIRNKRLDIAGGCGGAMRAGSSACGAATVQCP